MCNTLDGSGHSDFEIREFAKKRPFLKKPNKGDDLVPELVIGNFKTLVDNTIDEFFSK